MHNRTVQLEGIQNCRDLGGLTTADGHTVRYRALLRSANLASATPADLEKLTAQYRLAAVIDLRTDMERGQMPDRLPSATRGIPIPILDESVFGITHENGVPQKPPPELLQMERLYSLMVTLPACRARLGEALTAVMEQDLSRGSVLWHCTEGKDRCGLVSALLLLALSVDRATVTADYLLTNRTNARKAEPSYRRVLDAGESPAFAEAVRDAFLA